MENKNSLVATGRIDVADVLRGFAVMGIVVLHSIEHYNFYSFPEATSEWFKFTDKVVWESMFFTFGGKAYAIFALLFGLSFFIQDDNQTKRGKDFRRRFAWRLVLLFVIGNVNAMFFTAEILVLYSIIGFILIPVSRWSNKAVFTIAAIFMLQPMAWWEMITALCNPGYVPAPEMARYYFEEAFKVQTNGNFLEMIKTNLWEGQIASLAWAWEHGRMFQTASLFMLGMLVGRTGKLRYSEENMKFWFRALIIALVAYFPLTGIINLCAAFIANQAVLTPLTLIVESLANLSFMIFMVATLVLLFYSTKLKGVLMKLSPYGRMSLTDYFTQSILGSLLFYGWGFGLHRYLGVTASFLVGITLFLLQFAFANWWMRSHKHGPMEWIWKKATWIKLKKED